MGFAEHLSPWRGGGVVAVIMGQLLSSTNPCKRVRGCLCLCLEGFSPDSGGAEKCFRAVISWPDLPEQNHVSWAFNSLVWVFLGGGLFLDYAQLHGTWGFGVLGDILQPLWWDSAAMNCRGISYSRHCASPLAARRLWDPTDNMVHTAGSLSLGKQAGAGSSSEICCSGWMERAPG